MLDDNVLQHICMGKMPQMLQVSLAAIGVYLPMNKLYQTADKLREVMTQNNLNASARTPSDDITQILERNNLLKKQIGDLT